MVTLSKLFAWSLAASLLLVAGCGDPPHVPQDDHWTSQYSEFRGARAAAEYDVVYEVMMNETMLENGILIEAPSIGTAIEILKSTIERGGSAYQLDYTVVDPDFPPFQELIQLNLEPMTLGEAVNAVAKEAKANWNYSSGVLTVQPQRSKK